MENYEYLFEDTDQHQNEVENTDLYEESERTWQCISSSDTVTEHPWMY